MQPGLDVGSWHISATARGEVYKLRALNDEATIPARRMLRVGSAAPPYLLRAGSDGAAVGEIVYTGCRKTKSQAEDAHAKPVGITDRDAALRDLETDPQADTQDHREDGQPVTLEAKALGKFDQAEDHRNERNAGYYELIEVHTFSFLK